METYERRQSLLDQLSKQRNTCVSELTIALDVSEGTVWNDLIALELQGLLTRVHGVPVLHQQVQFQNNSFSRRYQQNIRSTFAIAREVAALVNGDGSILVNARSTAYCVAQTLSKHQRLWMRTNGLGVEVIFPPKKTCCGQPLFNNGFEKKTRAVIIYFLRAFPKSDAQIIGPSGSSVSMVKHHYPSLFKPGTPAHSPGNRSP